MRRLISLLPVLLVSVVACGGSDQPAVTRSPTSPSTTSPARLTLAGLAEQPCLALSEEDTVTLEVFVDGTEQPDPSGKSCEWGAQGAIVRFTAYPAADRTQDPDVQHLTAGEIEGRPALVGTNSRSGTTGYTILVASRPGQSSFRILAVNYGEGVPGPDALTVGKNFAAAILRGLG